MLSLGLTSYIFILASISFLEWHSKYLTVDTGYSYSQPQDPFGSYTHNILLLPLLYLEHLLHFTLYIVLSAWTFSHSTNSTHFLRTNSKNDFMYYQAFPNALWQRTPPLHSLLQIMPPQVDCLTLSHYTHSRVCVYYL